MFKRYLKSYLKIRVLISLMPFFCDLHRWIWQIAPCEDEAAFSSFEEERGSGQGDSGSPLPAPATLPFECSSWALPPLWHRYHPGTGAVCALWCSGATRSPFLVLPAWSTPCLLWPAPSLPLLSHGTAREKTSKVIPAASALGAVSKPWILLHSALTVTPHV